MIAKTLLPGCLGIAALAWVSAGATGQAQDQAASPVTAEASPSKAGETVPTKVPEGYALVWSDEFDTPGLPDPAKWSYDTFRNKDGWFNNEKQYYAAAREENARVADGRLIIEARSEDLSRARLADWGKQEFSSARLITRGLGDWTYGFFEIRAKLPCGRGTWPAIWMLPSDEGVKWPEGGEIDIMEHVGFDPGVIHHSIHTSAFNFSRGTQKTSSHQVPDACGAMHKYQLLWTADFMIFGVDDRPKLLFKKESDKQARWPFDRPQHLLLNIAVGGTWGGQKGIDIAAFPARMEVDYVRVYQLRAPKTAAAGAAQAGGSR
jgi:beta-glucanase (GH16 family)